MQMLFALLVTFFACASAFYQSSNSSLTSGNPRKFKSDGVLISHDVQQDKKVGDWMMYKQCDSRWAGQRLGWCDGLTICDAGCAMSSMAMMLATKGINVNPSSLDEYLSNNGGYFNGCELIWRMADDFGVTSFQGLETADEGAICNGLAQGHGIIANVNNGGHWVLLTGCAGNGVFYVNDPGYNRDTYGMWDIVMEAVYH